MSTNTIALHLRIAAATAVTLGAGALAVGALAVSAPTANAASLFAQDCYERPYLFHPQAVYGDVTYEGPREVCRVYNKNEVLLATLYETHKLPRSLQRLPLATRV